MAHMESNRRLGRLLRGELMGRWEQLTDADLEACVFDRARLIEALQARYGFSERRAEKEANLFYWEFDNRLRLAA